MVSDPCILSPGRANGAATGWSAPAAERGAGAKPAGPSLCVVNYNGADVLPTALAAAAQGNRFAEIVVIDNASTDGSAELAARRFPGVRTVRLADNRGPGAARNAGLREARTDLVLFVDNDVALAPGCADLLLRALQAHPRAAVAAPRVLYAHNREVIQYDGADNHFLGLMVFHNQDRPLGAGDSAVRTVDGVISACFLVDRSRLPDLEPFDESFFIYVEDHDFGLRLRLLGLEILSVPQALCFHGEGTAELSIRKLGKYSKMRVVCLIRNRWLLLLKNYAWRSLLVLAPILLIYELAQLAIVIRKGWLREWLRAAAWVAGNLPAILAKRRAIQRARTVADRDLLVGGPIPLRPELVSGGLERAAKRGLDLIAMAYWKAAAAVL